MRLLLIPHKLAKAFSFIGSVMLTPHQHSWSNAHGTTSSLGCSWHCTSLGRSPSLKVVKARCFGRNLVKRYHSEVLEKRGAALQAKIEAMRLLPLREHAQLSWPLISVFDDNRQWVGYAMRRMEGVPLFRLAHAKLYQKSFPDLDRIALVSYLLQSLHTQQVFRFFSESPRRTPVVFSVGLVWYLIRISAFKGVLSIKSAAFMSADFLQKCKRQIDNFVLAIQNGKMAAT